MAAWTKPGNWIEHLAQVPTEELIALYQDPQELPSLHLDTIGAVLG
ncbi:hypothetical protein GCM10028822_00250 [Hymenobacter terrigena]